jgi:hypothetical protein
MLSKSLKIFPNAMLLGSLVVSIFNLDFQRPAIRLMALCSCSLGPLPDFSKNVNLVELDLSDGPTLVGVGLTGNVNRDVQP